MKKTIAVSILIAVIVLILTALPAVISADPDDPGGAMDVYPGCTTAIKLHAWNAEGTPILLWVFKFSGSWEELLDLGESSGGADVLEHMVYGTLPDEGFSIDGEGVFIIDSNDWHKTIKLKLSKGHYFAVLVPIIESDEEGISSENFIVKEFNVSGCEEEDEIIPWVRDREMTCWQSWINENNNFEFIFFWEYKNNNWVKIYDIEGNEVFSIDMPKGNARFEADLPGGLYIVKTFHDNFETPIQEFVIGKP